MKSQLLTILLLGISLRAYADSSEQQAMLREFMLSCRDCKTLQYGTDPENLTPHECPTGKVCGPLNGAFSCIDEDSPDAASCSCGSQTGYIAEPYNPKQYIACLPGDGGQATLDCTAGIFMSESTEIPPCGAGPACVDSGEYPATKGFNALLSETEKCTKYFFCEAVPATDANAIVPTWECPAGQVYDITVPTCVDPCSLAPEPFACEAGASGPFPDPEDCGVFHLCFNGVKIGDPIPCPDGELYSNLDDDMKCIPGTTDTEIAEICTTQAEKVVPCYEPYKEECAQR